MIVGTLYRERTESIEACKKSSKDKCQWIHRQWASAYRTAGGRRRYRSDSAEGSRGRCGQDRDFDSKSYHIWWRHTDNRWRLYTAGTEDSGEQCPRSRYVSYGESGNRTYPDGVAQRYRVCGSQAFAFHGDWSEKVIYGYSKCHGNWWGHVPWTYSERKSTEGWERYAGTGSVQPWSYWSGISRWTGSDHWQKYRNWTHSSDPEQENKK